jgi:hydroxyethylthiazole kinase-like uncharacterized protein yjeF
MAVRAGHSLDTLMDAAGRCVAQLVLERRASAAQRGVLVACGPGNNGGDGWVAARALHVLGISVWVAETGPATSPPALAARALALQAGVRIVPADGPWPGVGLAIDALLGTGARGAPDPHVAVLTQRLTDLSCPLVAIDGPTGLDLATGVHHGALCADLTITFGGARRGHLLARDEVGDLVITDIGLPPPDASWPMLATAAWCRQYVVTFPARSHKGTRGHVVILGGSPAMVGAARLCARAAFAAGAGLVHVVAPEASVAVLRAAEPDVQTVVQDFAEPLGDEVVALIARADVLAVGPGLGRDSGRDALVLAALQHARLAVADADALTVLKSRRGELQALAGTRPIVCTPHVGEFRTLFPEGAGELETDPWRAAGAAAADSGVTVLLKGVPTVVTVAAGNPGLSTGGSGDVLTGVLAALLAQGVPLPAAAAVAAQAHGEAADVAARRHTARAMRPMDVIAALADVWRLWARHPPAPHPPVLVDLPRPRGV